MRERRLPENAGRAVGRATSVAIQLLTLIGLTGMLPSRALGQGADLPLVIPQPQAMQRVSKQHLLLSEAGIMRSQAVATESGALFDEAAVLIKHALRAKAAGSGQPATTIVLSTLAALESGAAVRNPPTLAERERSALARSDQAYVIRMPPGGRPTVWIIGASPLGVYYGATTLIQLITSTDAKTVILPHVEVQDYPDMPGRMCADWVLAWDWEINGYDWGDGLDAFIARCKRKIDFCARYKVNRVRFLGGRIAPGPPYMKDRWARILRFAPELNRYARSQGVALQYSSTSFGIDHYGWGLPYPEPWVLNRESHPDGKVYLCVGGTAGGCLANDALIDLLSNRQKQLVQAIEPASLYLHNIDLAMYKDLAANWKTRCPRCRERFPDDEPYSPRGYAGAVAGLYNRITKALRSVKNATTGYDASRDLEIVFASPGYSYWPENDEEWGNDLKYFSQIARQVVDKRMVHMTFREQFNRRDGGGLRTAEMARTLEQAGWPNAMLMFAVQGADFLDSPNLLVSSPVLTGTYRGAGALYNFNGHAFSEVQVLANVNYAWNNRAAGSVDPSGFPGALLRAEATRYSTGAKHSDFLYGRFLETACAAAYGEKAAPAMAELLRLERTKGPIVPLVAWIDYQWQNAAYDWRGQADRNLEARRPANQAAAACDTDARPELLRLSQSLEVSARICMLCDALHREKPPPAELAARADKLLAWLDANFQFQITEPDGGDPGLWKAVIRRISAATSSR
jgi:hypothetical protein